MKKLVIHPLTQLALASGTVVIAITTLVIHFDFKGSIDIQVSPQGSRLTIDNRQVVDKAEPSKLQTSEKR